MIHLYYGDGEGKTSAAAGLALRALSAGWSVCVVQFLKDGTSGEMRMLAGMPHVTVFSDGPQAAFTFQMSDEEAAVSRRIHDANLAAALELVGESDLPASPCQAAEEDSLCADRLLVLDEALDALRAGLLDEDLLRQAITWGQAGTHDGEHELVLTGHSVPDDVCEAADYITCMHAERHPYECGIPARRGVEY